MLEILLIPLQALFVAFAAAGATAIVLGTWPTPEGTLGVFLLYCVVCAFFRFILSLPPDAALFGRLEYHAFIAVFLLAVAWTQSEFLRPQGYPRMTFNQVSTIFFFVGIALYASDYVVTGKGRSQSDASVERVQ